MNALNRTFWLLGKKCVVVDKVINLYKDDEKFRRGISFNCCEICDDGSIMQNSDFIISEDSFMENAHPTDLLVGDEVATYSFHGICEISKVVKVKDGVAICENPKLQFISSLPKDGGKLEVTNGTDEEYRSYHFVGKKEKEDWAKKAESDKYLRLYNKVIDYLEDRRNDEPYTESFKALLLKIESLIDETL